MPRLVVHKGSVLQRQYSFNGNPIIVVGRATANDIVLPDSSRRVSRHHAALVPVQPEGQYFIRDLGSLHTTRLSGRVIDRHPLRDGDVIEIGDYALVFSNAPASTAKVDLLSVVSRKKIVVSDMPTRPYRRQRDVRHVAIPPDRSELLDHLSRRGASGASLKTLLGDAAMLLMSLMSADCGFARLFLDAEAHAYEDVGVSGISPGDTIEIADGRFMDVLLSGRCFRDGTTVLAPLLSQKRAIGFFCLERRRTSRPFTDEDGDFLIAVGRRVTSAVRELPEPSQSAFRGAVRWEEQLVGRSDGIRKLLVAIKEAAKGETNVLLVGETGSGKELAAKAIRRHSSYANGPFIAKLCAQTTESVAEVELFGYAPKAPLENADPAGAPGWFEMANGGTLFLDEIQSLSPSMQDKFLRVLQEKEIWRYGARHPTPVDVKVIAATSVVDLDEAVAEGRFQKALYYRFRHLTLPPLRERREDIPLLAFYFLDRHAAALGASTRSISRRALQTLSNYSWPGNVRELEGQVLKAVTRDREVIFSWDLDILLKDRAAGGAPAVFNGGSGVLAEGTHRRTPVTMREVEREKITEALEATQGNITRAWKLLGYGSRTTILSKMDQLGIPRNYGDPNKSTIG